MKLWTFDPNLHLSLSNTTFCLPSCFVCLFVYLFACFLVCLCILLILSPATCYACHVYHIYLFMPLSYAFCIFSFHCLSLPLHVRTWNGDTWSQDKVSQVQVKRARMRACRSGPAAAASRFNVQLFPFWLCTLLNPLLPSPFLPQMVCIRYIMLCTIHPHLQSMVTPVYFLALIFWAMHQGCRHLLSCSVFFHYA